MEYQSNIRFSVPGVGEYDISYKEARALYTALTRALEQYHREQRAVLGDSDKQPRQPFNGLVKVPE